MTKEKLLIIENELYNFIGEKKLGKYETLSQLTNLKLKLIDVYVNKQSYTDLIYFIKDLIHLIENNHLTNYVEILEKVNKELINVINEI